MGTRLQPFVFRLKIEFFYIIEVADFESDLGLHGEALVLRYWYFFE